MNEWEFCCCKLLVFALVLWMRASAIMSSYNDHISILKVVSLKRRNTFVKKGSLMKQADDHVPYVTDFCVSGLVVDTSAIIPLFIFKATLYNRFCSRPHFMHEENQTPEG